MLLTLYTIVVVLLLFGITIFVHELGHFIVARWCGLVPEVFSIGFGPAIWKREHKGVLYKVGILPLGGYVSLPQMDPGSSETKSRTGEVLPPVAPWKKILVALAGVTCNMILAYFIAVLVYWGGKSYAPLEEGALVGFVDTNSVPYQSGMRIGDEILSVNDQPVNTWDKFLLTSAFYDEVQLEVRSAEGTARVVTLNTEESMGARRLLGLAPLNYCYILQVQPASGAEEAGLKAGDRVVDFDGIKLFSREHMSAVVDTRRDQLVPAHIMRGGELIEVQVRPRYNEELGRALIGIQFNTLDVRKPMDQIKSHATLIFRFLKALVTPKEAKEAARGVGGPLAIFTIFWLSVQTDIILALWFTGLLNVNLAVLNLLPIPVLDGGHIVFAIVEGIRRKPVSARFVAVISNACAAVLLLLFVYLTYRDALRLPAMSMFRGEPAAVEAGTNATPAAAEPSK